ncbi:MAG: FHA domain-containing protein [Desulfuromonadales bacterium]|nr:FHA domain-containing protein [Desulfuromonadales bacterium]NIS44252.1 FHA domain-containing protein [Desulfuromonadales bacterium]
MAKIVVIFKNKVLKEVAIGPNGIKIGREPDNDIQIDNIAVSRCHAEIYRQGYPYFIEDLKSTNGTYLNGRFLNWKSGLNDKDKITIGKHTLLFIEEAKDGSGKKPRRDATETLCLTPEDLARLREKM